MPTRWIHSGGEGKGKDIKYIVNDTTIIRYKVSLFNTLFIIMILK